MKAASFPISLLFFLFLIASGCSDLTIGPGGSWNITAPPVEGNGPQIRIDNVFYHENMFGKIIKINVKGTVYNVEHPNSNYKVAIYIRVNGGWWPKPYYAERYTKISAKGGWANQVVTGGCDERADAVRVELHRITPGVGWNEPGEIVATDIVYKPADR